MQKLGHGAAILYRRLPEDTVLSGAWGSQQPVIYLRKCYQSSDACTDDALPFGRADLAGSEIQPFR